MRAVFACFFSAMLLVNLGFALSVKPPKVEDGLSLYNDKRLKEAFSVFRTLCSQRHSKACFSLAFMYESGQGVPKSDSKASKYYDRACKGRISAACFNLGLLYERKKRTKQANLAFAQGCALRHNESCKHLATGYEKAKQHDLSVEFYEQSCKLKDATACFKLAQLYDEGSVTRQNTKAALFNYSNSCNLGLGKACFALGEYHESRDKALARRYYGKACDENYSPACLAYKRLDEMQAQ